MDMPIQPGSAQAAAAKEGQVPVYDATKVVGQFLRDWLVCGPFPNAFGNEQLDYQHDERCWGMHHDYLKTLGGERGARPKPGDVIHFARTNISRTWVLHHSKGDLIAFDSFFKPNDRVVAYAYCEIESPSARRYILSFGSNDEGKVWLDGALVHNVNWGRWLAKDNDYVPISLKPGRNRLLVKVDEGGGDWGMVLRLLDYDTTIEQLRSHLDTQKRLRVVGVDEGIEVYFGQPHRIEALNPGQHALIELIDEDGQTLLSQYGLPGRKVLFQNTLMPRGYFTAKATFELGTGETVTSQLRSYHGKLPRHARVTAMAPTLALRDGAGNPYVPIGTYGAGPDDYKMLKAAGYTFAVGSAENLDRAESAGLKLLVGLHAPMDGYVEHVRKTIEAYKHHPAVLGWMMYDEPAYNRADLLTIHAGYLAAFKADPVHPAYLVITSSNAFGTYGRCCDVLAIDSYPIAQGDIGVIWDNVRKAYRQSGGDQPVWHCGQTFAWPRQRLPTLREHRLMTYAAVASGAKAFLWFSLRFDGMDLPRDEPDFWKGHLQLLSELHALQPVIVAKGTGRQLTVTAAGNDAHVRAVLKTDGKRAFLFAFNPSRAESVSATIQAGTEYDGLAEVWHESRQVAVTDGLLKDHFDPLAVHVYRVRLD